MHEVNRSASGVRQFLDLFFQRNGAVLEFEWDGSILRFDEGGRDVGEIGEGLLKERSLSESG